MGMAYARAALRIKAGNTNSVQGRARGIVAGIGAHAQLASLVANATAIDDQVTSVDKAETLAATRAKGTAAARNVQRKLLVGMLKTVLPLVQAIADQSGTVDAAIATIEAAGLVVVLVTKRIKPILGAKQGQPGSPVVLEANATALGAIRTRKNFFNWQVSSDGGLTWVTLPPTGKCKTSVANLTPLTHYGFRVALSDSSGVMGEWSQVLSFLVH